MKGLIARLRSYLPLGDGSLWSKSSFDIRDAANALEAQHEEIECLQIQLDFLNAVQAKNVVLAAKLAEAQQDAVVISKLLQEIEFEVKEYAPGFTDLWSRVSLVVWGDTHDEAIDAARSAG